MAPSRSGYTFAGWYIDNTYTEQYDFRSPVRGNITLYAKWNLTGSPEPGPDEDDGMHHVTFVFNDGSSGVYETQTVADNETISKPVDPERELYRFTGWYTEAATAAEYNFSTPVTSDFTLYAGWGNPVGSNDGLYFAASGGGTEASISGIERDFDYVYVTINTPEPATLVVEFLDEDEFWNAEEGTENDLSALQGIATQTPNYCEMEAVTIPLTDVIGSLPEYYVLRVNLYGPNGEALCNPYYSIGYTSVYEKFDSLTVQDRIDEYGENRVITFETENQDGNYGVFAEDVKSIDTSTFNILTVIYEDLEDELFPTTKYSFADPDETVSALQVGDKVYALDKDGYPQLFKIASIEIVEGSIVMTPDEDVILSDFYIVLKADMDGAEENVIEPESGIQPYLEIINVDATLSTSLSRTIQWKPLEEGEWLTVSGSLGGKAELAIKLAWDAKLFSKDYFEASAIAKVEASVEVSIEAEANNSDKVQAEWKSTKVIIPTSVPGLTVFVQPSIPVELSLSGTVTIKASASLQAGFSYNTTSGFQPVGKATFKNEVNFTAKATVKVGPKVAAGVAFLEKVVKADASVQAGISASVSTSLGEVWTNEDSKHGCSLCLDGEIKWFKNAKTSLPFEITEKLSKKFEKTIYEAEISLGECYLSILHDGAEKVFVDENGNPKTGPVFGWGSCPNKTWRTTFKAQDSEGNEISNVAIEVTRQDNKIQKTGTTTFTEYLNNGVYTASGIIDGIVVNKSFTVNNAKQEIVLTPASTDRALNGIVTDADTTDPIEEADVVAKQGDMIVASTKTTSTGSYTLNLPEGNYLLEVSKTGYITTSIHVAIPNNRDIYQNVELTSGETGKGGFSGRIVDATTGEALADVALTLRAGWNASSDGMVLLELKTNANGEYKYEIPTVFGHVLGLAAGSYTLTATKENYVTKSFNITILPNVQNNQHQDESLSRQIQVASGTYQIVLTWGEHPRDLDSHVVGVLDGGTSFHVYFAYKSQYDGSTEVCNLDIDDVTSYGPETITLVPINDQPYYYYIHKFAGESDIAHSNAQIDLYDENGLVDSFNAPTNQGNGDYWNVFTIVDGRIVVQNTITDSADITYAGAAGIMALDLDEIEDKANVPSFDEDFTGVESEKTSNSEITFVLADAQAVAKAAVDEYGKGCGSDWSECN